MIKSVPVQVQGRSAEQRGQGLRFPRLPEASGTYSCVLVGCLCSLCESRW